jgi:hypothetical protein
MKPDSEDAVNHSVSCDSENIEGRVLGRIAIDGTEAVLEMFLTLDKEARRRVFETLAEWMEEDVFDEGGR